jgi:hypothetical protein
MRPILRAFILALLPGMEEEAGEHFERVLDILDQIRAIVSPEPFFQSIWLIMLTSPPARSSSLNVLLKRLPKARVDEGAIESSKILDRSLSAYIRYHCSGPGHRTYDSSTVVLGGR